MQKTTLTMTLGVLGWVTSYAMFTKWLSAHGWDFWGGWWEAFTASDFATGLIFDLVACTIMMVGLALWDRERIGTKWTLAVIASLGLSVSMSLALYVVAIARLEAGAPASEDPPPGSSPEPEASS